MLDNGSQHRVLVVDDEPQLRQIVNAFLSGNGFNVREAADGDEGVKIFDSWQPHVVITDLSMLRMGGLALCREIRKRSTVPIIVLSIRNDSTTRAEAFDCGADQYLSKPFSSGELLSRVRAALRRVESTQTQSATYVDGPFRLDMEAHKVHIDRVGDVSLTPKELQLMVYLFENPRKVIPSSKLVEAIWGKTWSDQTDGLRALVHQLRKKIEPDASTPTYLRTDPWVGYRFDPCAKPDVCSDEQVSACSVEQAVTKL
jgi:two-component system KDP operon response regulator KdpE